MRAAAETYWENGGANLPGLHHPPGTTEIYHDTWQILLWEQSSFGNWLITCKARAIQMKPTGSYLRKCPSLLISDQQIISKERCQQRRVPRSRGSHQGCKSQVPWCYGSYLIFWQHNIMVSNSTPSLCLLDVCLFKLFSPLLVMIEAVKVSERSRSFQRKACERAEVQNK